MTTEYAELNRLTIEIFEKIKNKGG